MNGIDIVSVAQRYVARGWTVIQLHSIHGDTCSCGSADPVHLPKQGGKHPLHLGWESPEPTVRHGRTYASPQLRSAQAVEAAWAARPDANIGIVTGRASGFWVLDVDPDNGGHHALAGLVSAYGVLPETYTVTTGSGGMHYYWQLPEWEPTAYRGRLPAGLDVRGWHGQVVAPPSVSGKGPYRVGSEAPVAASSAWLLDMIRPPERVERPAEAEGWSTGGAAPVMERGVAYAVSARDQVLSELAYAPPGTRNQTAFRAACRLIELGNAPWSRMALGELHAWFLAAAERADVDGTFSAAEAASCWSSAMARMGTKAARLPEVDYYGGFLPLDALAAPPVARDFSVPGTTGQASPLFLEPGDDGAAGGPVGPPVPMVTDPRELAITTEMSRLWVREEAARRLAALRSPREGIVILDREAQRKIKQPDPLVAGWLYKGQAARLYGPPGSGKSFVAVDMAACVSVGRAWHGAACAQGEVVYVAAEDAAGVALRLRAWERHHGVEHRVHLISVPVQLDEDGAAALTSAIQGYFAGRPVALVVLDTQAMVTVGRDENDAGAMGVFVAALKALGARTGAATLTVHHSGVKGGRARGSTSVLGAMDVEFESAITGRTVTVTSTKAKNTARPAPLLVGLNVVDMDEVDTMGAAVTSCVLLAAGDAMTVGEGVLFLDPEQALSSLERRALGIAAVLVETNASGETYARVRTRAVQAVDFGKTPSAITSTFSKAWAFLVGRGRIAKAMGRESFYFIELDGYDRLAMNPQKLVQGGPEVYIPTE